MRLLALLAALSLPALTVAAPVPKAIRNKSTDAERLVGTWKVTALDGKPTDGRAEYFMFEAKGKCRMAYRDDDPNAIAWTWALGPDESPKRMSLTRAVSGAVYECAYELDGDSLTVAYPTGDGKPPPAKVAAGKGILLFDLKREPAN